MLQLTEGEVGYLQEILEMCLEFMEKSHVEDIILNKINTALDMLEEE